MVLVRPPLNNWPRKSVSNTNVKAEFYIKRISTVDILLISSCFRLSDKWNPGIISRFLQIYFQGRILSLFIHHSSIYFQYTPIDSDGKRGFSMEWAKVSLWHLSSNGVTKTIYFFLVDISDIHSVSDHSILKYEALSYHGRSLRALSDYLLPYFPSNENKVCSR